MAFVERAPLPVVAATVVLEVAAIAIMAMPSSEANLPQPRPAASMQDFESIDTLLAGPEGPLVTENLHTDRLGQLTDITTSPEYKMDEWKAEVARQHHLTLPSASVQMHPIGNAIGPAVWPASKALFGEYGIDLRIADQQDLEGIGGTVPTQKDLQNDSTLQENVAGVLDVAIVKYPKEFIQRIGIKAVALMSGKTQQNPDGSVSKILGQISADHPGVIYLDIGNMSAYDHEQGHWVNKKEGYIDSDPDYTSLNPGDIYNKNTDKVSLESYIKDVSDAVALHYAPKKRAGVATYLAGKEKRISTVSDYSFSGPIEDEAEMIKTIEEGKLGELLDPNLPILNKKTKVELGHLYQFDPDYTAWRIATSVREENSMLAPDVLG